MALAADWWLRFNQFQMIYDRLERLSLYRPLSANIARAIDYAQGLFERPPLPLGRVDIDGEDVFGIVHDYPTKLVDECKWEAHRRYIDLQVILAGVERMDVCEVSKLSETTAFDVVKDVAFFAAPRTFQTIIVPAGSCAFFFPHDAHRPGVAADVPGPIRKLVLKIGVD